MQAILDRFEGNYGILEINGEMVAVKRNNINANAKEGDVLILINAIWTPDFEATKQRKEEIEKLSRDLWQE